MGEHLRRYALRYKSEWATDNVEVIYLFLKTCLAHSFLIAQSLNRLHIIIKNVEDGVLLADSIRAMSQEITSKVQANGEIYMYIHILFILFIPV